MPTFLVIEFGGLCWNRLQKTSVVCTAFSFIQPLTNNARSFLLTVGCVLVSLGKDRSEHAGGGRFHFLPVCGLSNKIKFDPGF